MEQKKFKKKFKTVSKKEFKDFIKNYPGKVTADCCLIGEPPSFNYYDFTFGSQKESLIAYYIDEYPASKIQYKIINKENAGTAREECKVSFTA